MKLIFELWINKNPFSENAKHLFGDAILCYKTEAYTASLLMSYLGFLTVIKDRLMASNKPSLFPQGEWEALLRDLQNEDKWENTVFNSLQQAEKTDSLKKRIKDPIFNITDSLRIQIKYWKDRRNDCAHFKDNNINNAHVESFWTFLESNLYKITVEGGFASLINKLKKHYDITYTPANQDVTEIIKQINGTIEKADLTKFWQQAFETMSTIFDYDNEIDFIQKILKLDVLYITTSLLLHVKSTEHIFLQYINRYPERIQFFNFSAQEIRNLWKTKISKLDNCISIYASMLRNKLIPEDQIPEANKQFAYKLKYTDDLNDHLLLKNVGFGDIISKIIFEENNPKQFDYWKWLNQNSNFVAQYITHYPLSQIAVETICIEFNKEAFYSFFLQSRLEDIFAKNVSKKAEFIKIATELNLDLPFQIASLSLQ